MERSLIDREKIEASLPCAVRGALYDICQAWGIPSYDEWPNHPLVADFVTLTAARTLQARKIRWGLSRGAALREACAILGLSYETTRRRIGRQKAQMRENSTMGQNVPKAPKTAVRLKP